MLALRSYGQSNGFSVMDADELFFINGGSGNIVEKPNTTEESPEKEKEDPTYKFEVETEGGIEIDEETGKPKGSASVKISYTLSGKKSS